MQHETAEKVAKEEKEMPFPRALGSYCQLYCSGAASGYIVKPGHIPGLVKIVESCQWNRPKFSFFLGQAKYTLFFNKNVVFQGQAEYSYFSADLRL